MLSKLYPLNDEANAAFWARFWDACRQGKFNIPKVAMAELLRNSDLRSEIKRQRIKLISHKPHEKLAQSIRQDLADRGKLAGRHAVSMNDLRIIAIAIWRGMIVVTEESQVRESYNIPTVCREKKVLYANVAELRDRAVI